MKNIKKIFALLMVVLTIAGSMVACTGSKDDKDSDTTAITAAAEVKSTSKTETDAQPDTETETTAAPTQKPTEKPAEKPVATEAPKEKETEAPKADVTPDNNIFFNDNNNILEKDRLTIRPRRVYWDNGVLVAECFVINGFSHNVFNINVKSLSFANKSGMIAQAGFGTLNGVSIAPSTHIVWTFKFSSDCISAPGADLSSLQVNFDVTNKY